MGQVFYNSANELATISTLFAVDGVATDPGTVSLVVTDPTGTVVTYSGGQLTHDGPGAYHLDVLCASAVPGVWVGLWIGDSTASDVDVVTWNTFDTDLSKLYYTPAELKSRGGITDTLDDLEILGACLVGSQAVNDHCGRTFWRTTGTRTFEAYDGYLQVPDLVSITSLATSPDGDGLYGTTWAPTDYQLLPYDAPWKYGEPWPYTAIRPAGYLTFPIITSSGYGRIDRVQITGVWGWPRVPVAVRQAAAIYTNDLLKLGGMAFGVAGYGDYGAVRARPNPIAEALLRTYVRDAVMVA